MNVEISVVIPIYNASKSLNRCIDSVLNQTFVDYELILVDDGSTDGSEKICDKYAEVDDRVRVIHKINEGVSKARRVGIEQAVGVYSIHVDADDYIDSRELELLYSEAINQDADIVVCDYVLEYKPNKFCVLRQNPQSNNSRKYLDLIFEGKRMGTLWNKLIRTSLYENVEYPYNINYCEDVCIMLQILSQNIKLAYVAQPFYHYCFNNQSITRIIHRDKINDRLNFIAYVQKEMKRFNVKYDMSLFKVGAKLAAIKSGLYSFREYSLLFEDDAFYKSCLCSPKDNLYIMFSKYMFGYVFLRSLFLIRNKITKIFN